MSVIEEARRQVKGGIWTTAAEAARRERKMRVELEFAADNAAFAEDPWAEIARILRDVATQVEIHQPVSYAHWMVKDLNGNIVGAFDIDS